MARNVFSSRSRGIAAVAVLIVSLVALPAGQSAVPMDTDDIAGVVTGPNGPETGVWVIAETRDLPTRHIKIVVTDDLRGQAGSVRDMSSPSNARVPVSIS